MQHHHPHQKQQQQHQQQQHSLSIVGPLQLPASTASAATGLGSSVECVAAAAAGIVCLGDSSGGVSCIIIISSSGGGNDWASAGTHRMLLGRHAGRVTGVCAVPLQQHQQHQAAVGGAVFATCSADSTIKLWRVVSDPTHRRGSLLQTLSGHAGAVTCVAAMEAGHTVCLLSGSTDGRVLLWHAGAPSDNSQQQQQQQLLHASPVAVWVAPDRQWILALAAAPRARAFVVTAQQAGGPRPLMQLHIDVCQAVSSLSSQAGGKGVSRPASSSLRLLPPSSPSGLTGSLNTPSSELARQGAGTSRCSTSRGSARTIQAQQQQQLASSRPLPGTKQLNLVSAMQPQHLAVLTLDYAGCCRLHSLAEGSGGGGSSDTCCCTTWRSPTGSSYTAAAAAERMLLLGDDRGSLHLVSLETERLLATKHVARSRIMAIITCCCSSSRQQPSAGTDSSSSIFAVLSEAEGVTLWCLQQGTAHSLAPGGHRQALISLQACTDGQQPHDAAGPASCMLLSAGLDGRVIKWALPPGGSAAAAGAPSVLERISTRAARSSELTAALCMQGRVATGHDDGSVLLWGWDAAGGGGGHHGAPAGGAFVLPRCHSNTVACMAPACAAISKDGQQQLLLLSGGFDGRVCVLAPRAARGVKPHIVMSFQAHGQQQQGSPPSSDTATPATPPAACAAPVVIDDNLPEVLALAFHAQQQAVITGGSDGRVRVWTVAAAGARLLGEHLSHTGPINCLALDGCLLFSGSQDTSICVWDAVPAAWRRDAAAAAAASDTHAGSSSSSKQPQQHACDAPFRVLRRHAKAVTGLAVAAAAGVLVSCSEDGRLMQHDIVSGQLLRGQAVGFGALTCCAAVGMRAYVGSASGQLLCCDVAAAAAAPKLVEQQQQHADDDEDDGARPASSSSRQDASGLTTTTPQR